MSGTQQQLGDLEELVLLAVRRLGEGAWGASIREELSRHAGRRASIGTIYVTLMRLEEKGLTRSWMGSRRASAAARRNVFSRSCPKVCGRWRLREPSASTCGPGSNTAVKPMPAERVGRPPRLAVRLVCRLLPEALAEAVAGDLEEEYRNRSARSRGRLSADFWYWSQLFTLGPAPRRICRRLGDRPSAGSLEASVRYDGSHTEQEAYADTRRGFQICVSPADSQPGLHVVAVLAGLGIGANTAMLAWSTRY